MARFSYLFRESPEAAKTAVSRLLCIYRDGAVSSEQSEQQRTAL